MCWIIYLFIYLLIYLFIYLFIYLLKVLEGGYDLEALASSALAHCNILSSGYSSTLKNIKLASEGADVKVEVEVEKGYGGDEVAALNAYIKDMKLI